MTMSDDLPQPPERMTGGCMCGAVRYTIAEKPLAAGLCHCNRCRPQSGSAFSTVIFVHRSAITITGETAVFDDIGSSGLRVLRRYCPRCGSPLTTEADVTPDVMFVKAGGINSNEWFHPVLELFVGRRRPWVSPVLFDPRAVTAVMGHREEVTELLKLPFDFIFFTGSTKVGKIVMKAAAENLTPVLLELGGQNPALVDETANIADAAKKIVWGAMAWGGQWCTSPGYAYVHESVAGAFVAEARKAVVELYGKDPKTNPDYSKVVSAREVSRLAGLIDPGKVVSGGRSDPQARYLDPTIVYPITWDDPIMEDEVFGPILPILTYKTLDEALARIAATPHPLAGFVFSRDQKTIDRFIGELSYGGGAVNQVNIHLFIESMPFGGVGSAGMGHYYGKYGFDMLTHAKSLLISPPDVAIDHLLPPYTNEKNEALKHWFEY
jgi:hypothetical protein